MLARGRDPYSFFCITSSISLITRSSSLFLFSSLLLFPLFSSFSSSSSPNSSLRPFFLFFVINPILARLIPFYILYSLLPPLFLFLFRRSTR